MSAVLASTCSCGSIGRSDLRQCSEHFHIWRGDVRLTSVGRIVHASFPLDPSIPAATLENARDRGSETDKLFAAYVLGKLDRIPAGTRRDSYLLFEKLRHWYDRQNFKSVEVQVLLGGDDHGGVLDFRFDGLPCDLKCTYNVEHSARLQVAGYHQIDEKATARDGAAILHVTERLKEPRLIPLDRSDYDDWLTALAHWRMLQRRGRVKDA